MRRPLLVTGREYPYPSGKSLISVTDLKGQIVFCSSILVDTCGYTRDEYPGQPRNIVRHQDTPVEAYRDLRESNKQGLPWTGPVKNRRRNDDHYWVQAKAAPTKDGDQMVGFLAAPLSAARLRLLHRMLR